MFDAVGFETLETQTGSREGDTTVHVIAEALPVRQSLAALIDIAGWRVVAHASVADFLAHPCPGATCLVVDTDLKASDDISSSSTEVLSQIDVPTILIGPRDVSTAVRAIKDGAVEFLAKPINAWALLRAIDAAAAMGGALLEKHLYMRTVRTCFESLSQRERQVMLMVARGRMNKQVAGDLGISEVTVKAHRGQAMRKMCARTFAELVNMATMLEPAAPRGERSARRPWIDVDDGVATSHAQ